MKNYLILDLDKMVKILVIGFCVFLLSPFRVIAQADSSVYEMGLEELMNLPVSIATKTERTLDEAPGTIRVITRQQISDMNARTLKDVLNVYVPGMDALPTSLKYGDRVETVFSRGINSDFSQQILYLFNGKNKFNETTFGQPLQFIEFTLENIERIEVSTSPLPIQGGSAITTINLITRDQEMDGIECHFNTGVNERDGLQSFKFTTLLGNQIKGWHVGSSMQYYEDKGQSHNNPLGTGGFPLDPSYIKDGTKGAFNFTLNIQSPDKKLELASWYKYANQDAYLSGVLPWASSSTHNYIGTQFQNYIKYKPFLNTEVTAGLMTGKLDYPGFPFYKCWY